MNKDMFSRRRFLGLSAIAAGSLATKTIWLDPDPLWAMPQAVAPSDRVRFGIIGIGMQGSGLLTNSIELPGVECVAACDLYDGRHALSKEIVNNPSLPTTRRYQELLANKGIDCLIAAVPDHWHKQIVVDAVSAGKDIYCEKPMSHTAAEGVEMADAARKTGRIVQIGSQRVSSVICAKAKELVAKGALGDLMLVEGSLGINEPPKRTMAMGGILRWKDGRNMPDVHAALFQYGDIPVYMRLNLGTESPEIYRFQGSKGILELTEFSLTFYPQSGLDTAPSYYASGFPRAMREEYFKKWHQEHNPVPGKEPALEGVTYRSDSWDDEKPHLWNFFQAVRSRKPVVEDAVFGHNAALACHLANESYFRRSAMYWDAASKSIKT